MTSGLDVEAVPKPQDFPEGNWGELTIPSGKHTKNYRKSMNITIFQR